jgi:hypothetical protein
MRNGLAIFGLFFIELATGQLIAQSPSSSQFSLLCELQTGTAQGEHRPVRVEGVYLSGLEGQYLVTSGCSGRSTSIEFDLKSRRLWKQLVEMSNRTNTKKHVSGDGDAVLVVFDGEFYGPQAPDPKLPEAIRKIYHPGWDNNESMTKLVVHTIQSVEPLPADHPCATSKSDPSKKWPCWQHDPLSHKDGISAQSVSAASTLFHESGHVDPPKHQ